MSRSWRLPILILFCGSLVLSLNLGIRQSLGLFIPDLMNEKGWSAGTLAFAFAIQNLVWGLASPLGGMLADRWGTAKTLALGCAVYASGLALMGMSDSVWMLHGSAGLLIGAGVGATTFPIVLGAIGRAVPPEKRSFALGIASAGGSFGQFIMAPVTQQLNLGFGPETALLLLAAISLLMVPAGLALAGKPEPGQGVGQQSLTEALREAAGQRSYLLLMAGFFVCGFHVAFISVHLPVFSALCGMVPAVAATSLALVGLFNIFGTLTTGALGGRYPKKWLLSGIYFGRAVAIGAFMLAPKTEASFLIFASVMGFLWLSTVPPTSGLIAQIFGPRYLASLFGLVMLSHQVGAFLGAWSGGLVYDLTGSYDAVWVAALALGVFAGLVHLPIREAPLQREAVPA
ncbi:MFS transporter [Telmatospirillum sp. J64-1]|uniref:MFS transporter n=1 Tax=Telmatospirillum sp. J64-1 TaxID=2502183 RepID=UPI00115D1D32|nr:MFS transporter [Telmatospirillum sp. J64-1]